MALLVQWRKDEVQVGWPPGTRCPTDTVGQTLRNDRPGTELVTQPSTTQPGKLAGPSTGLATITHAAV